eukprot:TRINITY_DN6992_c0_g1_i2.p1 TRINITY_DN6992_c0_g1~~TRINITY_DN6992_c0_g1_i2.p1  ORF type:complete len:402 (+),score=51.81 TRINITY_DN6992_c0_g1_i2:162-1208(+)
MANLLVAEDWTIKISDFGLSLRLEQGMKVRGFGGNVKYSPPEILRARIDETISEYPYCEKTDVYGFGYLLYEIITLEPLFPENINGREQILKYVLEGGRPRIEPGRWPQSFVKLVTSCWDKDQQTRPTFKEIQQVYPSISTDLLCPDELGRQIIELVWKGKKLSDKIPYTEFTANVRKIGGTEALDSIPNRRSKTKIQHSRCLSAVLCDPYEDTVTMDRFCEVVRWFGPLKPFDIFLDRIANTVTKSYFHGFISEAKAERALQNYWDSFSSKRKIFVYIFGQDGTFKLVFIDKDGFVSNKTISNVNGKFVIKEKNMKPFYSFGSLHKACKQHFKLKKALPNSPLSAIL